MADRSKNRGPRSPSLEDIFRWAVEHDVDSDNWWRQQWLDNKAMLEQLVALKKRVRTMEDSWTHLKGSITVWAAVGSFVGAVAVAILAVLAALVLGRI